MIVLGMLTVVMAIGAISAYSFQVAAAPTISDLLDSISGGLFGDLTYNLKTERAGIYGDLFAARSIAAVFGLIATVTVARGGRPRSPRSLDYQEAPDPLKGRSLLLRLTAMVSVGLGGWAILSDIIGLVGGDWGLLMDRWGLVSGEAWVLPTAKTIIGLLLGIAAIRWGTAVIRRRSSIAYLPGRSVSIKTYGVINAVLTAMLYTPIVALAVGNLWGPFEIIVIINAVATIIVSGEVGRETRADPLDPFLP